MKVCGNENKEGNWIYVSLILAPKFWKVKPSLSRWILFLIHISFPGATLQKEAFVSFKPKLFFFLFFAFLGYNFHFLSYEVCLYQRNFICFFLDGHFFIHDIS